MPAGGSLDKSYARVLLATEDTEFDSGAERVAIDFAAKGGLSLMAVLPLVTNPVYESLAPLREEHAEEQAAQKIEMLTRAAADKGVQLQGVVRRGEEPFREIVEEARARNAELLVLRRRGKRSFLANLLLGEMVHTVAGVAPCDVLLVPRASGLWSKGIVLATNGSPDSEHAGLRAARLAGQYNLPLTVACVSEPGEEGHAMASKYVERALALVRAEGAPASGRVIEGEKPGEEIVRAAEEIGADLIVVGRRGLNPVRRMLVGSTSEWVASHSSCPTLIVHSEA